MDQRGLIRWLKHADKSYSNMTIRLVSVAAASRSTFKGKPQQARELLDLAARYVTSVPPGEPVLMIGYKGKLAIRGERFQLLGEAPQEPPQRQRQGPCALAHLRPTHLD